MASPTGSPKETNSQYGLSIFNPKVRVGTGLTLFVVCTITALSGIPGGLAFFKVIHISEGWMYTLGGISAVAIASDGVIFIWLMTEGYFLCKQKKKPDLVFNQQPNTNDISDRNDHAQDAINPNSSKTKKRVDEYCSSLNSEASVMHFQLKFSLDYADRLVDQLVTKNIPQNTFFICTADLKSDGKTRKIYCVCIHHTHEKDFTVFDTDPIVKPNLAENSFESAKQWLLDNQSFLMGKRPYYPQA